MKVYCTDDIMDRCKYSQASHYKKSHEKDKRTCDYILKTGRRRPCPWTACTVFEEREDVEDKK